MAEVVTKLVVDSQEYDNKIKRAVQGLQHYADACKKAGSHLEYVDEEALAFAKSLGSMEANAKSATGSIVELANAYKDMSVEYNKLTSAEKRGQYGKALSSSLYQLKNRIKESKAELSNIEGNLTSIGEAFKQLGNKIGVPTQLFTKLGPIIAAAGVAIKVATDAFKNNKELMDDWGGTVEEAGNLYKGFLNALNTGNISGFLRNIGDIISSSRDAYDAILDLTEFQAFNKANVARAQTKYENATANYREGKGTYKEVEDASNDLIKGLLERQKLEEKVFKTKLEALAKTVGVSPELLRKALTGSYGDFKYLKENTSIPTKQVYNSSTRSFVAEKDYDSATEEQKLGEALRNMTNEELSAIQSLQQQMEQTGTEIERIRKRTARITQGGRTAEAKPKDAADKKVQQALEDYANTMAKAALRKESGLDDEKAYLTKELSAHERLFDAYSEAYNIYSDPKYKSAMEEQAQRILELSKTLKDVKDAEEDTKQSAKDLAKANHDAARIDMNILNGLIGKAQKTGWTSEDLGVTGIATKIKAGIDISDDEWKDFEDKLNERLQSLGLDPIKINFETGNIESVVDEVRSAWKDLETGVGAVGSLVGAMDNLKSIGDELTEVFNGEKDAWSSFITVMEAGLSVINTVISVHEALNALKKAGILLSTEKKTAEIEEAATTVGAASTEVGAEMMKAEASGAAAGANAAEASTGAAKSVANIPIIGPILAVAALGTVLAATLIAISQAKSSGKGFANGGKIPGNSYSGDNMRGILPNGDLIGLDAGEVILNRAQQSNVASQLQGGVAQKIEIIGRVRGRDILLSANNDNRSRGGTRGYYANVK